LRQHRCRLTAGFQHRGHGGHREFRK
jgi:hypothetical protein